MRKAAFERDWTKGSIIRNLLSLAWPMTISGGIYILGYTVDMIWVGRLGVASIAGAGVSAMVIQLVNAMMMGFSTGTRALLARFIGAHDAQGANHVAQQAFVIVAGFSIVVAATGIFLAEPILTLFGLEADVIVGINLIDSFANQ